MYIRGTPEQALAALQTIRNKVGGRRFEEDDYIKKKTNVEGVQIPIEAFSFVLSEFMHPPSTEDASFSFHTEEFRAFIRDQNLHLPLKDNDSFPLQSAVTDRSTSPLVSPGDGCLYNYHRMSVCGKQPSMSSCLSSFFFMLYACRLRGVL